MAREVIEEVIRYNRLCKLIINKRIKKTEIKTFAGVSTNVITKISKNGPISMEELAKIYTALDCDISDIVEMTKDAEQGGN